MASLEQDQVFELPPYSRLTPQIISELKQALGEEKVVSDPDLLAEYSKDSSHLCYTPEAAVRAGSPGDVQAVLRLANQFKFPVIPWGSGTGVAGGALASLGGVVLSMAGMNRIKEVSKEDMVAVAEPGVIVKDLKDAARQASLFLSSGPGQPGQGDHRRHRGHQRRRALMPEIRGDQGLCPWP